MISLRKKCRNNKKTTGNMVAVAQTLANLISWEIRTPHEVFIQISWYIPIQEKKVKNVKKIKVISSAINW